MNRSRAVVLAIAAAIPWLGCAADAERPDEPWSDDANEVRVDTRSPEARRQYEADVAFASTYAPRCARSSGARPRVLVTGFGRFMSIDDNATGRIVSALVDAPYPETRQPPPGEIDDPAPQLAVTTRTIELPGVGAVDVCGMVLPVYWDLAAILIAKETDAFRPSLVLMNGVAGARQPIWLELGAYNRAAALEDGSNQLRPAVGPNERYAKLVDEAPAREDAQGNLLSWRAVQAAARAAIALHADDVEKRTRFGEVLADAKLAGFPRASNTYLCNNVTYTTAG